MKIDERGTCNVGFFLGYLPTKRAEDYTCVNNLGSLWCPILILDPGELVEFW